MADGERSGRLRPAHADLSTMALFVTVVEEGSLSAAGRALGMPKATVSRHIAALERRAGLPLLARSTRALSLTDAGRRHFERVRNLVHEARAAEAELLAGGSEPSGTLRVSVSVAYGQLVLAPRILAFAARHPGLRVELDLNDDRVDIIAGRFDMVVRMGPVEDSDLICRRLADMPVVLVASPGYLNRAGTPRRAIDLAAHDVILAPVHADHWRVGDQTIRLKGRIATPSILAARLATLAGLGIARLPLFAVASDLADAALVTVLPDLAVPPTSATALTPRGVARLPALRLLLESLRSLPVPGET